jgi:nitrate reductase gamma subunit
MNKEDILAMSRKEHEGKADEREAQILADANKVGFNIGVLTAIGILIISRIMHLPLLGLAAWSVFFPMAGGYRLYLFIRTKEKHQLVRALIGLIFGLACLIGMIVLGLQK